MGFLSDLFSEIGDTDDEKLLKWREELLEILPALLDDEEDDFGIDDDGDVIIRKGSAHVWVEFGIDDDLDGWVVIHSPLVRLPDDNLLPFYRKLLDLNNDPSQFGALSTNRDIVVLRRTIPVNGLDAEAFIFNVSVLCAEADALDDVLMEEFGAPRFRFDEP